MLIYQRVVSIPCCISWSCISGLSHFLSILILYQSTLWGSTVQCFLENTIDPLHGRFLKFLDSHSTSWIGWKEHLQGLSHGLLFISHIYPYLTAKPRGCPWQRTHQLLGMALRASEPTQSYWTTRLGSWLRPKDMATTPSYSRISHKLWYSSMYLRV